MGSVTVAWEDVISVIHLISTHLIVLAVLLAAAIIAVIVSSLKLKKPKKGLVNGSALIAFGLAAVLIVNMMLTGPLYNTLNVVLTDKGELTKEHSDHSRQLVEDITAEGIVLAKNNGGLPLAPAELNNGQINVFGWASTNPIYGGTGSGSVDAATAVDLLGGLKNAGFTVNQELVDKYTAFRADRPSIEINNGQDWSLPEPTADSYDQTLLDSAKNFSDWAIVVIARSGGEGADLPHDMGKVLDGEENTELREGRTVLAHGSYWESTKYTNALYTPNSDSYADFEYGQHYLELSRTERDLINLVTSNFDNVIVVYNGANSMEMGWTEDYEQIKGVLLCAGPGATGFNALGKIIAGEVNPSGKTVDLWASDLTAAPWYNNIGHHNYTDETALGVAERAKAHWERADGYVTFVDYVENIYVGYKFYETADAVGMSGFDYDSAVTYPFGYGLSYTTFDQSITNTAQSGDSVTITVNVTNTGSVAGKSIVELYDTPPYYFAAGANSHDAVNNILSAKAAAGISVDTAKMTAPGNGTLAGTYVQETFDAETYSYGANGEKITNQFDSVNLNHYYPGTTYVTRNDWMGTIPSKGGNLDATPELLGDFNPTFEPTGQTAPKTNQGSGLTIMTLMGLDYDNEYWDQLLDQFTEEELMGMVAYGGFKTNMVNSINKPASVDKDGPACIDSSQLGGDRCYMFPSESMLACTWNRELVGQLGYYISQDCLLTGTTGWYAPGVNIHRVSICGRSREYFSEDAYLSGAMAYAINATARDHGVVSYTKHFALNEQENNRSTVCTFAAEQAVREIYLKAFEMALSEGGGMGVMTSMNRVGTTYSSSHWGLCTGVLKNEWGFKGVVITDIFNGLNDKIVPREMVLAGADLFLCTLTDQTNFIEGYQSDADVLNALRESAHRICYAYVNSNLMNGLSAGSRVVPVTPAWNYWLYAFDAVAVYVIYVLAMSPVLNKLNEKGKEDSHEAE